MHSQHLLATAHFTLLVTPAMVKCDMSITKVDAVDVQEKADITALMLTDIAVTLPTLVLLAVVVAAPG